MDVVNSMILIANLVLCISVVYMLVEKVEDGKRVRVPYLSLGLLILFVFINLITILTTPVNIAHKIFYFVSFVALCALLTMKIMDDVETNTEKFSNLDDMSSGDDVKPNGSIL